MALIGVLLWFFWLILRRHDTVNCSLNLPINLHLFPDFLDQIYGFNLLVILFKLSIELDKGSAHLLKRKRAYEEYLVAVLDLLRRKRHLEELNEVQNL